MAPTGDDESDNDSLPEAILRRSSSAVASADGIEEVQYAQVQERSRQPPRSTARDSDSADESDYHDEAKQDSSHDEEEGDSDEDSDRENRFDGPASTWRFYTEAERNLAASLDQQRANDLSIHLYNAHALERRAREANPAAHVAHHRSRKHWTEADEDGVRPWAPDAHWTAWPLEPENVPGKGEAFGVPILSREEERSTFRRPVAWKPSLDLEEELQAMMLREAKERLRREQQSIATTSSLPHRAAGASSPRKRKRSSGVDQSTGRTAEAKQRGTYDRLDDPVVDRGKRYKVLLDDDEAAKILQPSIRHLISKLDDLLLGLYKSRQGQVRQPASSRSEIKKPRRKSRARAKSQATDMDAQSAGSAGEAATEKRIHKAKIRRKPSTSEEEATASHSTAPEDESRTKTAKRKRTHALNPRDWSEVLAIASMVGWDADVIQRSLERCTSLFGESMTFQKLGFPPSGEGSGNPSHGERTAIEGDLIESDAKEEEGFVCPVESCARHTEPWPLNKTWRWREHLKRSHKYSKAGIERLEAEMKAERVQEDAAQSVGRTDGGGAASPAKREGKDDEHYEE